MGLLDDLAMGFGLKERTEDYDARTARTIALNEQYDNEFDRIRARQSGDYDVTRGGAAQFLGSRGRDNYNPQIAQDNRSFGQRFLFSPESAPSPTPYAIGPLKMDQPLPKFGLLGMLSGLGGLLGGNTQQMGPPRTTVRPMLRPDGFTPPTPPTTNVPPLLDAGMNRFESEGARSHRAVLAGSVPSITPTTLPMQGPNMPASYGEFGAPLALGMAPKPVNDPAYPLGLAEKYSEAALAEMTPEMIEYLARIEAEEQGLTPITSGPHAGKYMDAGGRLVMP